MRNGWRTGRPNLIILALHSELDTVNYYLKVKDNMVTKVAKLVRTLKSTFKTIPQVKEN